MPYISQARRAKFPSIPVANTSPELAYLLSQVAVAHFRTATQGAEECKSVATVNQGILGAFDMAKAEFAANIVGPYEASRKQYNGDVFGTWESPAPALHGKGEGETIKEFSTLEDMLADMGIEVGEQE